MFTKILIANRGEIACRIIKTAKRLGVQTVAVYSDADRSALHVTLADQAVHIGPSSAAESYLKMDRIITAALETGAEAIHPGYGFLSENPEFADKIVAAGLVFIGPSADSIRQMGLKDRAKVLMEQAGVPVVPGYHGKSQETDFLAAKAEKIGYPVLIKARAGGGGKGMRLVTQPSEFAASLTSAQREGKASFGDDHVLIEKFITAPRHIEVQVFGDNSGQIVHLFERDCSLQRRHQKVIEEAPAPDMPADVRKAMTDAALKAARATNYQGAGTIEFIADGSGPLRADGFWFMEMNTRLQVEHPVTEAITGQDLVEWQLRVASDENLPLTQDQITINGHAFEARIYAEDPQDDFKPAPGVLHKIKFGPNCRADTGVVDGDQISPFYDPMIAKLISHAPTRSGALQMLGQGLDQSYCTGTPTNITFLSRLAKDTDFAAANFDTSLIERKQDQLTQPDQPSSFEILAAYLAANNVDLTAPRVGWQIWGNASRQVEMHHQGQAIQFKVEYSGMQELTIIFGDDTRVFTNIIISGQTVTARNGDQNLSAIAVAFGGSVMVKCNGNQRDFNVPNTLLAAGEDDSNTDHVLAPMTGIVTVLHVSPDQKVAKGDPLLVLEAMKMEHVLNAPRDGIIADILCKVSDAVDEGSQLVVFSEQDE